MKKILLFLALFSINLFSYQIAGSDSTLDIATWNIENFPNSGQTTANEVAKIISDLQLDLIGVEEITDSSLFVQTINGIGGYSTVLSSHRYQSGEYQKVGFIYNSSKLSLEGSTLLFTDDYYNFPRPPLQCRFSYSEGGHSLSFTAIVLHLKALGDAESVSRRKAAMATLKSYLDGELADGNYTKFVVIGDYNDEVDDESDNIFQYFLNDSDDYSVLTLPLAGNDYSYPSWPSLIDHLMITKDMFSVYGNGNTKIIHLENDNSSYFSDVSDHLPAGSFFVFDGESSQPGDTTSVIAISELQSNFSSYEGQEVTVEGVVTVPAGAFSTTYTSVYIGETEEPYMGINLYYNSYISTVFKLGAKVRVTGTATTYKGLHEIVLSSWEVISTDNKRPPYYWFYTNEINNTSWQGTQILVTGVIKSISGNAIMVDDGSGEGKVYIDSDTGIDFSDFAVGDSITAKGVLTVYNDEGELQPVFQEDIFKGYYTRIDEKAAVPENAGLTRNYPNPFNPSTKVEFRLNKPGNISLKIYNPAGQLVSVMPLGGLSGGTHTVEINGNLHLGNSGVYFIRLFSDGKMLGKTRRILFVK